MPWLKFGTVDFMAGMGRGGRVIGSREKSNIYYHYNEKSAAGMAALFRVIKLPKYNRVGVESVIHTIQFNYNSKMCLNCVKIINFKFIFYRGKETVIYMKNNYPIN